MVLVMSYLMRSSDVLGLLPMSSTAPLGLSFLLCVGLECGTGIWPPGERQMRWSREITCAWTQPAKSTGTLRRVP